VNERDALIAAIAEISDRGNAAAASLESLCGPQIDLYRSEIVAAVHNGTAQLKTLVSTASGGNVFCEDLLRRTGEYLDWLQWALWDLPAFAAVIRPEPALLRSELAGGALVYFACRILDDFLDRHYLYRGRRETLLANLRMPAGQAADGVTVMIAVLLYMEGISRLGPSARTVLDSMKRVVTGVLMEYSSPTSWDESFYERLIGLKNVDYWRILYAALDPARLSPLYPFLCGYYALAQKLNDVQDYPRDKGQGRPNLLALAGSDGRAGFDKTEARIGRDLLDLDEQTSRLPEPERFVALAKLAETCDEARRAGLFAPATPVATARESSWFGITWQSDLDEFLERAGPGVIESTSCPVCGDAASSLLFHKQSLRYNRCGECGHVYVSPHLRGGDAKEIRNELAEIPVSSWLGEKLFAADWARFLRRQAPGPRLLDVRFQTGIFPRAARAAGFQVYGVGDEKHLRPLFGERLAQTDLEAGVVPWGSFDVITALHALDRFPRPRLVLSRLRSALNPHGLIFIVVPDFDSLQFRIFGKRWDAINPVASDHAFCERSLYRLLRECGFEPLMRLPAPVTPHELRTRWMRLFRGMEGDETGDLTVLARVDEAFNPDASKTQDADTPD
jgi:hypothetical protein